LPAAKRGEEKERRECFEGKDETMFTQEIEGQKKRDPIAKCKKGKEGIGVRRETVFL